MDFMEMSFCRFRLKFSLAPKYTRSLLPFLSLHEYFWNRQQQQKQHSSPLFLIFSHQKPFLTTRHDTYDDASRFHVVDGDGVRANLKWKQASDGANL